MFQVSFQLYQCGVWAKWIIVCDWFDGEGSTIRLGFRSVGFLEEFYEPVRHIEIEMIGGLFA